jgi:hypothetical protein
MSQATIEIQGVYGPAGCTVRFLVTKGGDPSSVSQLLLQAALASKTASDLPRALVELCSHDILAGIQSCHDHADTASHHYQLWAPLEGCGLMILVRAVRDDKGRREWFVRNGPWSLETFLLTYQEVSPDALPLWRGRPALLEQAA